MRAGARCWLFLAATAILIAAAPASAQTQELVRRTETRPSWASYVVDLDGSPVDLWIAPTRYKATSQIGIAVYDEQNRLIEAGNVGAAGAAMGSGAYDGTSVRSEAVPGQPVAYHNTDPQPEASHELYPGKKGIEMAFNTPGWGWAHTGIVKVLFWATPGVESSVHAIEGDAGNRILASDEGERTFLYTSRDFDGAVSATNNGGSGGLAPSSERADVLTSRDLAVHDTLIGVFQGGGAVTGADAMTVTTPTGEVRRCPCWFSSFADDDFGSPNGPGLYHFDELAGTGLSGPTSELFLGGADARLPATPDR